MKTKILCLLVALAGPRAAAGAETLLVEGRADRERPVYEPGAEMVFRFRLLEGGAPVGGRPLAWKRSGDDGRAESGEGMFSTERPFEVRTTLDKPGFVRIEVWALDAAGAPLRDAANKEIKFDGGACVEPEKLTALPEPEDFDAFWERQRARLAAVPLRYDLKEIESDDPDYRVFDVVVDCAGARPVVGILRKPAKAEPQSLKAAVAFDYYAVHAVTRPYVRRGDAFITFNFNGHGIDNRREEAYYSKLREGELKNYGFDTAENSDPETAYFNGMALRLLRALEFVKSLPEWDGKNLIAHGGSQGGFQAVIAAGLDPKVSRCEAYWPAFCDLGGVNFGRMTGFRPEWTPALAYYDPVHHARRARCETAIHAGLGDYTCPPSGAAVLYNNLPAPKRLVFTQGATHDPGKILPADPQKLIFGEP